MPHLSPPTLTHSEQRAILRATACNPRDHLIYSLALGTGLRLAEIVGLDVGDVYSPDGRPRVPLTKFCPPVRVKSVELFASSG
jgi:integrase